MVGSAATLLGLLFVAVSVRPGGDFSRLRSATRTLAAQAFQNYLAVIVISSVALFPDVSGMTIGLVTLIVGSSGIVGIAVRVWRTSMKNSVDQPRAATWWRHIISISGLGLLLFAAAQFLLGNNDSLHVLAGGIIMLLVSSATISWQLLFYLTPDRGGSPE